MNAGRRQRIESLVRGASERESEQRAVYLIEACPDDEELRQEVEELLALAEEMGSSFLEIPAAGRLGIGETATAAVAGSPHGDGEAWIGHRLGSYRIEKLLGRGGTGEVYLARRSDAEYQQQVALKLIRPELASEDLIRRFRTERQILAQLDHPNIARLLDGGTRDDGQPYLVMEYIEGRRIDLYCDQERQTIAERIGLFVKVCDAVDDAHRNFVVHRDIKPSNLLVTADGVPKLLDFGIAKLLDANDFPITVGATRSGLHPMTPRYASPEQIEGRTITTASDVYSLAVVLYELLVGCLPFAGEKLAANERVRAICEREPSAPSTELERLTRRERERVGRHRRSSAGELRRQLSGDLDAILLKALRNGPLDRYRSVGQMVDDLSSHLEGRPVRARQGSRRYLVSRFIRRHRLAVGGTALVIVLLSALLLTVTVSSRQIARERDQLTRERDTAEETLQFLVETFGAADPSYSGELITAQQVLDRGAERVGQELIGRPLVQVRLLDAIGKAYGGLWALDRAIEAHERSLALRREHFGNDHLEVARSESLLAWALREKAEYERAAPLFEHALEIHLQELGPDHPRTAEIWREYGRLLGDLGDARRAFELYDRALAVFRRELEPDHQDIITTLAFMAILHDVNGEFERAEEIHREALVLQRQRYGDEHPEVAITLANLGHLAHVGGRLQEAEALTREALETLRAVFDDAHVLVGSTLHNLAAIERRQGKLRQARQRYEEVLRVRTELSGADHPTVAGTLSSLGDLLAEEGDLEGAEASHRRALAIRRSKLSERHADTGRSLCRIGEMRRLRGDLRQAERLGLECREILIEALGEAHRDVSRPLTNLARVAMARQDLAAAEDLFRRALEIRERTMPAGHWRVAEIRGELGQCLAARERFPEAEQRLVERYETYAAELAPLDARRVVATEALWAFYRARGRTGDAERVARTLVEEEVPAEKTAE